MAEVQGYLGDLMAGDWWAENCFPVVDVHIELRRDLKKWLGVTIYPNGMLLTPSGMTESTVLHELAHILTPDYRDHGDQYVEVLLPLVREQMGFYAWVELQSGIESSCAFD